MAVALPTRANVSPDTLSCWVCLISVHHTVLLVLKKEVKEFIHTDESCP